MGLDADVICIGQFSNGIAECLNYDPEDYDDVQEGRIVTATFFRCVSTSQSKKLAAALGVDPWDFNTHAILKDKVDWEALKEISLWTDEGEDEVMRRFKFLLEEKNFICVYRPNG
jgi:hypothetical protein